MKKHLLACVALSAFAVACSGGSGGTTGGNGGTTGSGNGGGTSTGGSTGGNTPETFCDGFGVKDSSGNPMLVETYSFSTALKAGNCYDTMVGYVKDAGGFIGWKDGTSITAVGGIYDVNLSDNYTMGTGSTPVSPAPAVIFPGGCDDMGLTGSTNDGDGGMNFTAPAGAITVAAAVAQAGSITASTVVYGVVTAVYDWTPPQGSTGAKSGSFYLQDVVAPGGTPAPGSGISVYMNKADIGTNVNPNRGDVVTITGFTWSPYDGSDSKTSPPEPGFTDDQNQLGSSSTSKVTVIGNAPLPPPVSLPATSLSPTATTSQYFGMRVTATGGPFTVQGSDGNNDCPAGVETNYSGD
jgi:hypothetical protein